MRATPINDWRGPLDALTQPRASWAGLPPGPHVMGIINATPDSFSDSGQTLDPGPAIARGERMLAAGASILDIGGESTRPGARLVAPEEEQRRILPIIAALARAGARVSVDTRNADTMARALDAGATIINDVSALRHDQASAALVARRGCPVVMMHMRGDPATMSTLAHYGDVAADVLAELSASLARAEHAGISRAQMAIDPGFGFAKTSAQSRDLLQRLPLFLNLSCPIIAGMSRKRFIGEMSGVVAPEQRDIASAAASMLALSLGATIVRAHNVEATVSAVRIWQAVQCPAAPKTGE